MSVEKEFDKMLEKTQKRYAESGRKTIAELEKIGIMVCPNRPTSPSAYDDRFYGLFDLWLERKSKDEIDGMCGDCDERMSDEPMRDESRD